MQEFLRTSWGKVCPLEGMVQFCWNLTSLLGWQLTMGLGIYSIFWLMTKRVTTHHVLQILEGYKHHHNPPFSNNVLEHVFEVKHTLWLSRSEPRSLIKMWMDGYVATYSCCMAQSVRCGFLLNDELDKSGSRIKNSHISCAKLAS